jgi:hypothetical protein
MARVGLIVCTIVLLSASGSDAAGRQAQGNNPPQQPSTAWAPSAPTGTQYSCRLNPNQPPRERRKKVSLICTPVLPQ